MAGWDTLRNLITYELIQRASDGSNVDEWRRRLSHVPDDEEALMAFYRELCLFPTDPGMASKEPDDLESIRLARPSSRRPLSLLPDVRATEDQFYGAWLGRCIGCALGKPIEGPHFMFGNNNSPGWRNVHLWFEGASAWPIRGYVPRDSAAARTHGLELPAYGLRSTREQIAFMETDDDIRYTVLGLMLLEEKGLNWDSFDVGKHWHQRLPYQSVCTAETQAYMNFQHIISHMHPERPVDWCEKQQWVRTWLNPYREWIGAQIRVDAYGYATAGRPELAAELAWRDASFSHVRNGIYGAMFCSAAIAAAFVLKDPEDIIRAGLDEIPCESRLYQDIGLAVNLAMDSRDPLKLADKIWTAFSHYDPVHTNNNAALCAASLIFGGGDFEKTITTAILGWDTDCNGATVGSILGAMTGASQIPRHWAAPLHDTLYSDIPGFHPISISECARRTQAVYERLRAGSCIC